MALKIFVGLGQSNMSGLTPVNQAPTYYYTSRIRNYLMNGVWQSPASDPLCVGAPKQYPLLTTVGQLGPGMSFADQWCRYHPQDEVGLCITARPGRQIAEFARDLSTDTMYGAAKARWEAALAAWPGSIIAGVLYYQGEADCSDMADMNAWAAAFQQLVIDLRSDIGDPNLPIVVAKIGYSTGTTAIDFPYFAEMRLVQSRIFLPRVAVVHNDDSTLYDEVHLDGPSLERWGRRAADAMRLLGA